MKTLTCRNRQYGLTLIEIMVALVISMFLLAGLLQLFIITRQSARVQENLSRVQENGRYAIDYLSRFIRLAGYRSNETIRLAEEFENKFNVFPIEAKTSNGEILTVIFEGENTGQGEVRDCLNALVVSSPGAPVTSSNTLKISNNMLQCQTANATQTIVEDVESVQVLYGENTDSDLMGVADRYVSGATIASSGDWNRVVSVRITLLLRTSDNNLVESAQPYTFNGASTTPTDRRLRRVFTTTIALRNRV
ncbi:MAG: prepilin-type N-terminal cleavage/methylation domain-containing protein [Synechococcaceae cyanobacterium SM1_2_3]|nr:prepilin-type N-terminal cleavage/methylation domain-containing protein [Synechococcaceae cyanobacterium SM1_2_3]